MNILVKYFTDDFQKIEHIPQGDWVDLRAAETMIINTGEFALIPLGVAMQLPKGFEAHVVPRSSTFKHWGLLQTNGMGIIDHSYSGNDDQWFMPALATRPTLVNKGDRICQFRIIPTMPAVTFCETKELTNPNRNGHGSTGKS